MPDSGEWRELSNLIKTAFPGAIIVSTYREGARTHATGALSYHARGQAIDIGGPDMVGYFKWIAAHYPNSAELIHTPMGSAQIHNGKSHVYTGVTAADHYDHVHWAVAHTASEAATGGQPITNMPAPDAGSNPLGPLGDVFTFFTTPSLWVRVGLFLAGAVVLAMIAIRFVKKA